MQRLLKMMLNLLNTLQIDYSLTIFDVIDVNEHTVTSSEDLYIFKT